MSPIAEDVQSTASASSQSTNSLEHIPHFVDDEVVDMRIINEPWNTISIDVNVISQLNGFEMHHGVAPQPDGTINVMQCNYNL